MNVATNASTNDHPWVHPWAALARRRAALASFLRRLLFGLVVCGGAHAVPTLSLVPSTAVVEPGGGFTLDLMASGVDQGIGGWALGLAVADGGVAALTGIRFSAALGAVGSEALGFGDSLAGAAAASPGPQRFDFGVASLLSVADLAGLQGTSFRLATLSFSALADGVAHLSLLAPVNGASLSDAQGRPVAPASLDGTSVSVVTTLLPLVSSVPEPTTAALLAAGLACLGVAGRVRRVR